MKTLNGMFAIGVAITAAAILAPAAFAQGPHGAPPPRPGNGIQLAADIVNLVRTVIEPRPTPVIVAPRERVVTTRVITTTPATVVTTTPVVTTPATVVTTTPATVVTATPGTVVTTTPATVVTTPGTVVTTTPGTTIVTGATTIPEYSYSFFYGEYVPYFEGWFFYADDWIWGGIGPRPLLPPRWIPPRREPPRAVVVRPERWIPGLDPAPVRRRTESSRTVIVPPQEKKSEFPVIPSQHRVPRKGDR